MWTSSLTAGLARGVFTGKYDQISSLASAIIFFNNGTVADTALQADTILLFLRGIALTDFSCVQNPRYLIERLRQKSLTSLFAV